MTSVGATRPHGIPSAKKCKRCGIELKVTNKTGVCQDCRWSDPVWRRLTGMEERDLRHIQC